MVSKKDQHYFCMLLGKSFQRLKSWLKVEIPVGAGVGLCDIGEIVTNSCAASTSQMESKMKTLSHLDVSTATLVGSRFLYYLLDAEFQIYVSDMDYV